MAAASADLAEDGLEQLATLVRCWLHEAPADDLEAFVFQAVRAQWMERRVFQTFADIMSKVMGGK